MIPSFLERAAERARLGLDYLDELSEASVLGEPIVAVAEASRIAGGFGVGQALQRLGTVIEEARSLRRRASLEGLILEAISALAPAVMAVALSRIAGILQGLPMAGSVSLPGQGPLAALAVLSPLPAEVLRRGYHAGSLGSLAAMLAVVAASGSL